MSSDRGDREVVEFFLFFSLPSFSVIIVVIVFPVFDASRLARGLCIEGRPFQDGT